MMLRDVTLVKGFAWDLKEHMFKVCLCSDDLFLVFIFVDLQEKAAFIFCVKDRGSSLRRLRWGNPCRLILALLITRGSWPLESESLWAPLAAVKKWNSLLFRLLYGLDEFFRYSDLEWSNKQQEQLDLGEVDWLAEIKKLYRQWKFPSFLMFISYNRPMKSNVSNKKPRFEISYDDEEDHFLVPDLGWM